MSRIPWAFLAVLMALAILNQESALGQAAWTPLGPYGGDVFHLERSPVDSGAAWSPILDAALPIRPTAWRFDPSNPDRLWVLGFDGEPRIFDSADAGSGWNDRGAALPGTVLELVDLAVDADDSQRIYLLTRDLDAPARLLVSENGGLTWTEPATVPELTPKALWFDRNFDRLYVAAAAGLFVSTDRGASWASAGFDNVLMHGISGAPPPDGAPLLATARGMYRGVGATVFVDGFESGRIDRWSVAVP